MCVQLARNQVTTAEHTPQITPGLYYLMHVSLYSYEMLHYYMTQISFVSDMTEEFHATGMRYYYSKQTETQVDVLYQNK